MCFSAEVSLGVAVVLLPAGAYCVETAWRKDRRFLLLAAVPVLFGLQQLCEARVWLALGRGDPELARQGSLGFLFFALGLWPVWIPLAVAVIEPPGRKRWIFVALSLVGSQFAAAYYLPIAADGGHGLIPAMVGHSIRYDFSTVPAVGGAGWWVLPVLYVWVVAIPLLASRYRRLRPIGAGVVLSAVMAYVLFEHAFASVWCFFAAVLSLHLAYALTRLPASSGKSEPFSPLAAH